MSAEQGDMYRLAAIAALASAAVVAILSIDIVASQFPRGLIVLACVVIAFAAAWYGLTRTGGARLLGSAVAILAVGAIVALLLADGDHLVQALIIVAGLGLMVVTTRSAFRIHVPLDPAPDPHHPVLFYNPKSGGGKAEKFHLADEARARGIEPIELKLGTDLEQLVRGAVAEGADALAMAGGDGSQAVVAMVAAELGLPYACIPAGTRNHFALDLGVDRDDVVGALDAFVGGREKTGRPRRGQRPGIRQQRLARPLRRGRPARGLSGGEAADHPRHAARGTGTRGRGTGAALDRPRRKSSTPPARRSSSPTIATASGVRSARAPGRGSTTGCWGSPLPPPTAEAGG